MRSAGLVAACDDPQLFGFEAARWPAQRERLAAVERGPRLHVWADGRRSLKTTRMALVGLWCCLLRPELLERLRPGERGYAVGVATNLRQARLLVRTALSVVERSPLLAELVEAATEDELHFVNGTGFAAFPCSSRGGRGWPIFALLMARPPTSSAKLRGRRWPSGSSPASPPRRRSSATSRGSWSADALGQDGFFAETFQRAFSGELEDAVAFRGATAELNPSIDPAVLARERERDPDGFYLDPERVADAVGSRGSSSMTRRPAGSPGSTRAFSSDPFGLALAGRVPPDLTQLPATLPAPPDRLVLGLARAWKPARRKAMSF